MTAPEGQRDERAAWSSRLAARDVVSDPGGHCRRGFRYGYEDGLAASRGQESSVTAPEPVVLTDGEEVLIEDAWHDGLVRYCRVEPEDWPDRDGAMEAVLDVVRGILAAERAAHEAQVQAGEALRLPDVEVVAAKVHDAWMESKRAQGVESRPSEWGEEQMAPYADLSERAKDLDRGTVQAVYAALAAAAHTPPQDAATEGGR